MKKYTIVYMTHSNATSYKYIEGNDLNSAVESSGIVWSAIWFVFDGHCEQTKD